jgi:hypothetical protein
VAPTNVVVEALPNDRHIGQVYEVTVPRLMSVAEVVREIIAACAPHIRLINISDEVY